MKPYGNQHKQFGDFNGGLNSTRVAKLSSKNRTKSRRKATKTRRATDKAELREFTDR